MRACGSQWGNDLVREPGVSPIESLAASIVISYLGTLVFNIFTVRLRNSLFTSGPFWSPFPYLWMELQGQTLAAHDWLDDCFCLTSWMKNMTSLVTIRNGIAETQIYLRQARLGDGNCAPD